MLLPKIIPRYIIIAFQNNALVVARITVFNTFNSLKPAKKEITDEKILKEFKKKNESRLALDSEDWLTFLTTSEYQLGFAMEDWPQIKFHKTREHN